MLTTAQIRERLARSRPNPHNRFMEDLKERESTTHLHDAAVLMPLLQKEGKWHLLFIRRTRNHNDRHSGQVAFPGGRADEGDEGLLATALREAEEEIALNPGDVTVLGHLREFPTVSYYQVRPFVGHIPWPYPLQRDPREVDRIFTIPLAWLADPNNHETRPWTPAPGKVEPYSIIFYQDYQGEILWGVSARMVVEFVERLKS